MNDPRIFCPSIWKCDGCGFKLTRSILYARTGNISQDDSDHLEPCPNDGRDMRRMTWEELFRDAVKVGEQQVERAVASESKYANLLKVIEAYKTICYYRPNPREWFEGTMKPEAEDKFESALKAVNNFEAQQALAEGGKE